MLMRKKAYYRVSIDYNWDAKKEGQRLCLGNSNNNIRAEKIVKSTKDIILKDLPSELEKAYGISVKTHVTHVTEGSIVVVFSAVFGFVLGSYYFVANYPNFKDGCRLLKEDLNRLLGKMLEKYSPSLQADVVLASPRQNEDKYERHIGVVPNASSYFWPMIVSLLLNIAVSGLLLLLVWKAVERMYF